MGNQTDFGKQKQRSGILRKTAQGNWNFFPTLSWWHQTHICQVENVLLKANKCTLFADYKIFADVASLWLSVMPSLQTNTNWKCIRLVPIELTSIYKFVYRQQKKLRLNLAVIQHWTRYPTWLMVSLMESQTRMTAFQCQQAKMLQAWEILKVQTLMPMPVVLSMTQYPLWIYQEHWNLWCPLTEQTPSQRKERSKVI